MYFKKTGLATLAAAALVLAANPAAAATSAYATMTVSYKLTDLDLEDNIAASISFAMPEGYGNGAGTYTSDAWYEPAARAYNMGSSSDYGTGNVSAAYTGADIETYANVTNLAAGRFTLTATGSANNAVGLDNSFNSYATASRQFTLSANTMVVFSAVYHLGSDTTPGSFDDVSSYAQLTTVDVTADNNRQYSSFESNHPNEWPSDLSRTVEDKARVSFTNLSYNSPLTGELYAEVKVAGYASPLAPVPEPESWAMMLAGLGFVGTLARRRKQAAV